MPARTRSASASGPPDGVAQAADAPCTRARAVSTPSGCSKRGAPTPAATAVSAKKPKRGAAAPVTTPSSLQLLPWPARRTAAAAAADPARSLSAAEASTSAPSRQGTLQRSFKRPAAPADSALSPVVAYCALGETCPATRACLASSDALLYSHAWATFPSRMAQTRVCAALPLPPAPPPGAAVPPSEWRLFDKAFSATWISARELAVTTKCGRVLRVNRARSTVEVIEVRRPHLHGTPFPSEAAELHDGAFLGGDDAESDDSDADTPVTRAERVLETLLASRASAHQSRRFGAQRRVLHQRTQFGGIHSSAANPSGTRLVVSGHDSGDNSAYVLDLEHPAWRAVHRAAAHDDWIFGVRWLSESAFVSAGRDEVVALWDVNTRAASASGDAGFDLAPVALFRDVHAGARVRCVDHDGATQRLATCDTAGSIVLWDAIGGGAMRVQRRIRMAAAAAAELTCMQLAPDALIVGGKNGLVLYDPRAASQGGAVAFLPTAGCSAPRDEFAHDSSPSDSVRSVACKGPLLSAGMSSRIVFLDKRMLGRGGVTEVEAAPERGRATRSGTAATAAAAAAREASVRAATELAAAATRAQRLPRWLVAASPVAKALAGEVPRERGGRGASTGGGAGPCWLDPTRDVVSSVRIPKCDVEDDEEYNLQGRGDVAAAVFHHSWAPDGSALFACGGPLAVGLRGCYMGCWS